MFTPAFFTVSQTKSSVHKSCNLCYMQYISLVFGTLQFFLKSWINVVVYTKFNLWKFHFKICGLFFEMLLKFRREYMSTQKNKFLNYWPISPDFIITKILNAPYWWAILLCVFIYNSMHWECCALCSEVRVLGDAALIHVNLTAHQHGERGISRHVWRACKGSIASIWVRLMTSYAWILREA